MRTSIASPELGERPDAGLATLALQGLFAARDRDWHNLPSNLDLALYDQYDGEFTMVRKADMVFDALGDAVYVSPSPDRNRHIALYGWQAVHFA